MKQIECEVWSRVVGFYRPVNEWNKGKKTEFEARKSLSVKPSQTALDERREEPPMPIGVR